MIHEEIINEQKFIVVDTTNREGYRTYTFILVQTTTYKCQNSKLKVVYYLDDVYSALVC